MAGKGNTLSKKTIIAIVAIIVLLFVAGLSVGIFLSDKGETEAVDGNQVVDGSQTEGNTTQDSNNNEQTGDTNPENPITDPDFNGVEGNENTTTTTPDNGNVEGTNNNNTTTNNGTTNNGTTNTEVTTGTDVNNVGETTVTRVEEQERLVSRDYWDWWTPINVAVASTVANLDTTTPELTVKKSAITGVGGDQFVYAGQNITYVITVTNNGNKDVENIEITDKIPQNTTFVSIDDAFILSKVDGELVSETVGTKTTVTSAEETQKVVGVKWVVTVPAGETVTAKFTVNVNKTMLDENGEVIVDEQGNPVPVTGTISNTAIANGEESNEGEPTKTAIITNNKSSVITRDKEVVKTAKVGDQITYTITVTNTGDVEGSTYITDTVPEGTKFVSAKDDAIVSTSEDGKTIVTWSIKVGANSTVTREFTVEVNSIDGKIKNIGDVGGTPTNEDENETGNLDVVKTASSITRNGENVEKDEDGNVKVKVGDVIEYTITVTNTGSLDVKDVVVDEQLKGLTIKSLTINGELQTTFEKNPEGKLIIGYLRAAKPVVENEDGKTVTPAIPAGEAVITATYTVEQVPDVTGNPDKTIYNKVVATGITNPTNPEINPEPVEGEDDETVTVDEAPSLEVDKKATAIKSNGSTEFVEIDDLTKVMVRPGDVIEYTITVTNTGNITLENIKVTDSLKVTVNGVEKDLERQEDGSMASVIAIIESLSAEAGKNVETIKTYYTVVDADTVDSNPIHNEVNATVPDGPSDSDGEDVPVNPDTSVSGSKTWVDGGRTHNNATEITLTLTRVSVKVGSTAETVNATPTWDGSTYTFSKLEKYDAEGYEYTYTVTETQVDGYDAPAYAQDNVNNITNTITDPADVVVSGSKTWVDGGKTHNNTTEITLTLTRVSAKSGATPETVNATPAWDGNTYTYSNLDRYDEEGYAYTYSVSETEITGYTTTQDGYNFTNTIVDPADVVVSGSKTWVDGGKTHNNATEITLTLTRLSAKSGATPETVNATPKWNGDTYTYSNLDRYDEEGYAYTYSVSETEITGYTTAQDGYNFTNTIVDPSDVVVSGSKTWVDGGKTHNNATEITLTLTRVSAKSGATSETVNATPKWNGDTYTYSNLDRYDEEGYAYTYSVSESEMTGYTTAQDGYNFTNTIVDPSDVVVSGSKTWVDGGKTHNNTTEITLTLTRVSAKSGATPETVNATPAWDGNTYTYSNLDRYDEEGYAYTYSVSESEMTGYTTAQDGYNFTNTIVDPADVVVSGSKTWVDGGKTHNNATEITLTLTRVSAKSGATSETVNATPKWNGDTYTYSNLDRYDEEGYAYTYSVSESEMTGYTTAQDGYNFTNTIVDPADVVVSGSKTWVDGGKTHNNATEITLTLTRVSAKSGATPETVNATPKWNGDTYTYSNLDRYDEEGYAYTYSVSETEITGYTTTQDGYNFTNTRKAEIVSTKTASTENGTITVVQGQQETAGEIPVEIGDTIEYTITVENKGALTEKDVTVQDTNPQHTTPISGSALEVTFNNGTTERKLTATEVQEFINGTFKVDVPAYTIFTFKFSVKVTDGSLTDKITNTAYVGGNPVGPTINSIERTVNVTKYKNNIASTNIILVLDVSSSMNNLRIVDARNAINTFVENTYAIEKNKNVTFTLLTFANRDYTEGKGATKGKPAYSANQKGGIFEFNDYGDYIVTYDNKDEFTKAVRGIVTDSGTNIRAGLEVTEKAIYGEDGNGGIAGMEEYKDYEQIVIFFGDGEPYGETEKLNNETGIKAKADDIRKKGAKIFSIGFGSDVSKPNSTGYKVLSKISDDGKVYTSSNYTDLVRDFSKIVGTDPSYDQITVNGNAIINITSNAQDIIVDADNPIIITVGGVSTIITSKADATANHITYTNKQITWDVSSYSESEALTITYYVQ